MQGNETLVASEDQQVNPLFSQLMNAAADATFAHAETHAPYYRSKIITSQANNNPVLASAAGLLAIACRLIQAKKIENVILLRQELTHEILSFETQAQQHHVPIETIRVGRYALCALLDEILLEISWDGENLWEQEQLLLHLEGDQNGDERFFMILERLLDQPKRHLHLLELIYICLSLGFTGKFHQSNRHELQQLDDIIDRLYKVIEEQHGEIIPRLTSHAKNFDSIHSFNKPNRWIGKLSIGIASLLLIAMYGEYQLLLEVRAIPVDKALTSIARNVQ